MIRYDERRFNRLALFGLAVSFVLLAVAFGLSVVGLRAARDASDLVTHTYRVKEAISRVAASLERAESARRGYLIAPSIYRESTYGAASAAVLPGIREVTALTADNPEQQQRIAAIRPMVLRELSELDRSMAMASSGRTAEAQRDFATVFDFETLRLIREQTAQVALAEQQLLERRVAEDEVRRTTLSLFLVMVGTLLVLIGSGTFLLIRRYTRELTMSRDRLSDLNENLETSVAERTGDLSVSNARLQTLLREVNHRVANSLQLVSAMVSMQSRHLTDDAARDALEDTQRRIHAVAQVHRSLYTSDGVEDVAMDDYLAALVAELEGSWSSPLARRDVRLSADPIRLDTDKAVALGMIVNELVTNACKYAYEEGASGEIRVGLARQADDRFELTVEDDGCGLDGDGEARGTGLGSRILTAMASSLSSTLSYDDEHEGCRAVLVASL